MQLRILAVVAILLFGAPAIAHSDDGTRVDLSLYFVAAGMDGRMTLHGLTSDLDVSFSDLVENLDGGFMGRAEVGHGRWFASVDGITMTLGAEKGNASADLTQWMAQPQLGYQVLPQFALTAGARYNSIEGDLTGPLGRDHAGTVDWWDPVIGGRARFALSRKLAFAIAADLAPFQVSSDLSWQAEPLLSWRFGNTVSAEAGYRWLDTDYSQGSGSDAFRYDVMVQGPEAGVTLHF